LRNAPVLANRNNESDQRALMVAPVPTANIIVALIALSAVYALWKSQLTGNC
jgi:hypothetical protein